MTVPTNIPETSMPQPNSESLQESMDTNSPRSMEVLQHVLQRILDIKDDTNSPRSMEVLQHVLQRILDIKDEEDNKSFSIKEKWESFYS